MSANPTVAYVDESLEGLIPTYLERRMADVAALRDAIERHTYEAAMTIGHRMKGSGGGYGFDPITDIGATIEAAAGASDGPTLAEATDALDRYLTEVEVVYVDEDE